MSGRHVKWYICGPTVYDSAHMGHARYVACPHASIYFCASSSASPHPALLRPR